MQEDNTGSFHYKGKAVSMCEVQNVLALDNGLGEGPVWNVREQALYWIDYVMGQFFRYDPAKDVLNTYQLEVQPGCVAFNEDGGIILATTRGIGLWKNGSFALLENEVYDPPTRFNDGAVDRRGRFWAGTASDKPENHLYRLDPDGSVHTMEHGIYISNGIGWSPDNRIMYYSDSGGGGIVYAYDFNIENGTIHNRRTFLPPTGTAAVADGLTVDSEGCIWIAYWDGWRVARYDSAGELIAEIEMPVQRPTSCNFGGPNLNELYITSAGADMDKTQQPLAGGLFKIVTDVTGIPEPFARLRETASR